MGGKIQPAVGITLIWRGGLSHLAVNFPRNSAGWTMAEHTFPRARCADFHFLFLLLLSIITQPLPCADIPHRQICSFSH